MKYVYLDQMHWIAFAKAAKGRTDGSHFADALAAARGAVSDGRAIFPLSFAHIHETMRAPRLDQRVELAALMAELSRGVVLKWSRPLIEIQLKNAVRRLFDMPELLSEPSPFGRGVEDALCIDLAEHISIPPDRVSLVRESLDTFDGWISLLSHKDEDSRRATIESTNRIAQKTVAAYELRRKTWEGKNADFARRAYAVFHTKQFWKELLCALDEVERTVEEWGDTGTSRLMEFWQSIPALHVEMELHTQMHRQISKNWSMRDDRDIGFLSLAVPSCDIVLTERFWIDLSHRRRLHERYSTLFLHNLPDLADHI